MNIIQAMSDPKPSDPGSRNHPPGRLGVPFWRACSICLWMLTSGLSCCPGPGLQELPERPFYEALLLCGRRSGKSLTLAMLAVFLALFRDWTPHLSPGERGTVLVLAADRKQAQSIMRYARAFCEEVPLLAAKIERVTSEELDFKGRVSIEVGTASYRTVRGRTLIAGFLECDRYASNRMLPHHTVSAILVSSFRAAPCVFS